MQDYEPLVIVPKKVVPWFDERIQDAHVGQQLHLQHMHALGLGFVVHPSAFVVRQPLFSSAVYNSSQQVHQSSQTINIPSTVFTFEPAILQDNCCCCTSGCGRLLSA